MEEAPRWADVFPDGLLPLEQESDNPFLLRPPRGATWRRTNSDPPQFFIANEFNAIAAANVRRDDLDELFPGHAELFDSVVSKVLGAANSGYMNDYEALPQEQVSALRLLMHRPAKSSVPGLTTRSSISYSRGAIRKPPKRPPTSRS